MQQQPWSGEIPWTYMPGLEADLTMSKASVIVRQGSYFYTFPCFTVEDTDVQKGGLAYL